MYIEWNCKKFSNLGNNVVNVAARTVDKLGSTMKSVQIRGTVNEFYGWFFINNKF
jgi:hypothetical protein